MCENELPPRGFHLVNISILIKSKCKRGDAELKKSTDGYFIEAELIIQRNFDISMEIIADIVILFIILT